MLRIGLVGMTKQYHGMSFSEIFNGYDQKEAIKRGWNALHNARIEKEAKITHIWDEDRKDAEEVAMICNIENVVNEKEELIGEIDGVIITDDCAMQHQKRAIPFLKTGIPTFIDKPLSPDIKEAEKIIKLAKRYNAPLMSCSALRYAKETKGIREGSDNIGEILTGFSICKAWESGLVLYGIHAMELLYSIVGPGIKSVRNIGKETKDIVIVKYKDGRDFVVSAYEAIDHVMQISLYGTKGNRSIVVTDDGYFYSEMLRHFVTMVETKKEPFPPEETLEIIKALVLGEKSRTEKRERSLQS